MPLYLLAPRLKRLSRSTVPQPLTRLKLFCLTKAVFVPHNIRSTRCSALTIGVNDLLKKLGRTVEKALGRPADHVLLVLDATTGQNAIQQAQLFKDALPLTGIVLTKLDGTAKGGVILGIVDRHGVPIEFIGVGERVEDLKAFDTEAFLEALFEAPESLEASSEAANAG